MPNESDGSGCYLVATRHCSMGRQATIGNIYLCNQLLLARPKRFEVRRETGKE